MSDPRCFYFGCWGEPGHYLFPKERFRVRDAIEWYGPPGKRRHIDGTLAPRLARDGQITWEGRSTREERSTYGRNPSAECPQGHFLVHHLDNGFTAMQWWDRSQGDTRGGCNSTILLEGEHTADEMLAALHEHFPRVAANLKAAEIELVEVRRTESGGMNQNRRGAG